MTPNLFIARFSGPEGRYEIEFQPSAAGNGAIRVAIKGTLMNWHVDFMERNENGDIVLGGLTTGSKPIWGNCYWFNIQAKSDAPYIEYWADQILWRKDLAVT